MPSHYTKHDKEAGPELKCPVCGIPLTARIKREWIIKYLLYNKPFRRYVCGNCRHKFYIMKEKL